MKGLIFLALLSSSAAYADFDSEFAAFQKDFDRLSTMTISRPAARPKVVAMVEQPSVKPAIQTVDVPDPAKPPPRTEIAEELSRHEVDPTSPDRLGHQLEDEGMKRKVTSLYNNPNVHVYSYVLNAE